MQDCCSTYISGLPQVIVMTNVEKLCPVVKDNLQKIYHSKKIKEKVNHVPLPNNESKASSPYAECPLCCLLDGVVQQNSGCFNVPHLSSKELQ